MIILGVVVLAILLITSLFVFPAAGRPGFTAYTPAPIGQTQVFFREVPGFAIQQSVRLIAELHASDIQVNDDFGISVAISDETLVIGADKEDGGPGDPLSNSGAVYVFQKNSGDVLNWGEMKILRASDAQNEDWFGNCVAIDGDTIIVGAPGEDGGEGNPLLNSGAAYIYSRDQGGAGMWGEIAILKASDADQVDYFGGSVDISGENAVVGSLHKQSAYIFTRNLSNPGDWGEAAILQASDAYYGDIFGWSVGISGDTAVVGAYLENGGPGDPYPGAGAAYVFDRNQGGPDLWGQSAILHASDIQAGDYFGISVAMDDDVVVVGAYGEDGDAGDPLPFAGAAYVFLRDPGDPQSWSEAARLSASDAQSNDFFGFTVAVDGAIIALGAYQEDGGAGDPVSNSGAAYLFQRHPGIIPAWDQVSTLRAIDAQPADQFGHALAVSGNFIIAGAAYEDGGRGNPFPEGGAAYLFEQSGYSIALPILFRP